MKNFKQKRLVNIYSYVITLVVFIICIIACMLFFYKNSQKYIDYTKVNNECTELDLYFLKIVNSDNVMIKNYGLIDNDNDSYYISFLTSDGKTHLFIKKGSDVYYNDIKVCENVNEFKVIVDKSYNQVVDVEINIGGKIFNMKYSLDV